MHEKITGNTKVFGVVADPIAHVRAPEVFNEIFLQEDIDAVCVPFYVSSDNIISFLEACRKWQNLAGIFVTIPHKEIISSACKMLNNEADAIKAVNVIRPLASGGWYGAMYDGSGFVEAMKRHKYQFVDKKVAVFGAGGAATAIVYALLNENVKKITIVNRNAERAIKLKNKIIKSLGLAIASKIEISSKQNISVDNNLIINATSLGLNPNDSIPIPLKLISKEIFIAEIIMKPNTTKLISYSEKLGCKVFRGAEMFSSQVKQIRKFFKV